MVVYVAIGSIGSSSTQREVLRNGSSGLAGVPFDDSGLTTRGGEGNRRRGLVIDQGGVGLGGERLTIQVAGRGSVENRPPLKKRGECSTILS